MRSFNASGAVELSLVSVGKTNTRLWKQVLINYRVSQFASCLIAVYVSAPCQGTQWIQLFHNVESWQCYTECLLVTLLYSRIWFSAAERDNNAVRHSWQETLCFLPSLHFIIWIIKLYLVNGLTNYIGISHCALWCKDINIEKRSIYWTSPIASVSKTTYRSGKNSCRYQMKN